MKSFKVRLLNKGSICKQYMIFYYFRVVKDESFNMARAWDKENIWVPDRNRNHDLPNTWRALTELRELMVSKVISLSSHVTGVLHTAGTSTVEFIVSSDRWMQMVNFELGNQMWRMNYSTWHEPSDITEHVTKHLPWFRNSIKISFRSRIMSVKVSVRIKIEVRTIGYRVSTGHFSLRLNMASSTIASQKSRAHNLILNYYKSHLVSALWLVHLEERIPLYSPLKFKAVFLAKIFRDLLSSVFNFF